MILAGLWVDIYTSVKCDSVHTLLMFNEFFYPWLVTVRATADIVYLHICLVYLDVRNQSRYSQFRWEGSKRLHYFREVNLTAL